MSRIQLSSLSDAEFVQHVLTTIEAQVEHIKPKRDADAYAGQESLTYVRCQVRTRDGVTGHGVTGRFLAAEIAHLLKGGFAASLKDLKK